MSAAWDDPLRMWLWLAVVQTTLCLGVGLLLGRKLSAHPARAHRRLVAAAGAALLTPLLAAVVGVKRWGLLASPANPVIYRSINPPAGELKPPAEMEVFAHCAALVLVVLWAIPAVVLLARIVSAMRLGWRAVSTAKTADAPHLSRALRRAAADLGLSRLPLQLDGGRLGPLLWRWSGQPVILVPTWAASGDPTRTLGMTGLQTVFRHELAHLKRADPWAGLLVELLIALLWWHPLAWMLRRRLLLAAEFACDDWTQFDSSDAADYAEALLVLSPACPTAKLPGAPAVTDELPTRLRRLLVRDRIVSPVLRRGGWVAAAVVALMLSGTVAVLQAHPASDYGSRLLRTGVSAFVDRFGR
jgi:beta-lactamase regulating signal transducer with metallopeptidase domain